jgi:hypothetical protein
MILPAAIHPSAPLLPECSPRALPWLGGCITFTLPICPSLIHSCCGGRYLYHRFLPYGPVPFFRFGGGRPFHKVQFLVWDLLEVSTVCCLIFSLRVFLRVWLAVLSFPGCSLRLVCSSFTTMLPSGSIWSLRPLRALLAALFLV